MTFIIISLLIILYLSLIFFLVKECKREAEQFRREWNWRGDLYD